MSTWRFRNLLLDKHCLASERMASSMSPVAVVKNNDTPIDNDAGALKENFRC